MRLLCAHYFLQTLGWQTLIITNDSKATVSVLYWYGNYPTHHNQHNKAEWPVIADIYSHMLYQLSCLDMFECIRAWRLSGRALTKRKSTSRGARTHDHKVKSLALYRLS